MMEMALDGTANGQSGSMLEIAQLTGEVKKIADGKIDAIRAITGNLRMLALNAMIEIGPRRRRRPRLRHRRAGGKGGLPRGR